jgi:MarR-like DNA-binding transcriptional regulator SgrR of sgrS sRNA
MAKSSFKKESNSKSTSQKPVTPKAVTPKAAAPKAVAPPAAAPKAIAPAPHNHANLESKIASLEATLVKVQAELAAHCVASAQAHEALEAKCDASASTPSAGLSASVEANVNTMWKWLRRDRIFRETISKK